MIFPLPYRKSRRLENPCYVTFPKYIYITTIGESAFSCFHARLNSNLFWREIRGREIRAWLSTTDGFAMLNESQRVFGKLQTKLLLLLKITTKLLSVERNIINAMMSKDLLCYTLLYINFSAR